MSDSLPQSAVTVRRADYADPADSARVVTLLDCYARDPMGGGKPLSAEARERLVPGLAAHPGAFSLLAFGEGKVVGLANCLTSFSTFAARPVINIHDMVVLYSARGQGAGRAMMIAIEAEARAIRACRITLEVMARNDVAKGLYASMGYSDFSLDPDAGTAQFWEKKL